MTVKGAHQDNGMGPTSHRWNGGIKKHPKGYVYIYSPDHPKTPRNRYMFEHILIMEKHLGRYLQSNEIVHHKNGIKHDNRMENLELKLNASHDSENMKNKWKSGIIKSRWD